MGDPTQDGRLYRISRSILLCRTSQEVFQAFVDAIAGLLRARNVILWRFSAEEAALEPAAHFLEDRSVKVRSTPIGADFLGEVFRSGKSRLLVPESAKQLGKHVQLTKESLPTSVLCIPHKGKSGLEVVLELIDKADPAEKFSEEDAKLATEALEIAIAVAAGRKANEDQAKHQLNAITRLTLLYDISQIFNATLELDQLLPIIGDKIGEILDADTCTVWLLDESGEAVICSYCKGGYAEIFSESTLKLEEDFVGEVLRGEEGILLEDATGEERLYGRFENPEETPVFTYMASPLVCQDNIIGVLEVLNRQHEKPFDEEDLFLLNDLAKQAATAIHNANLLDAERKAKELDALLAVSKEITSTLNLNKVLLTIVHQASNIIPYDRAAIALVDRERVEISAVSGKMEVDRKSEEVQALEAILTWCAHLGKGIYVSEFEEQIVADREETREKFKVYFERTGYKSFLSIPLKDEEGELGILSFESPTPYFLDERHLELVNILANQATVAIRNAQLYRQVPLINLMEPIMQQKARLMKLPQSRKIGMAAAIGVLLLLLIFVPWNMKVDGEATMLPGVRTPVVSEVEGIVEKVHQREGAVLERGALIAQLENHVYRLELEEREARRDLLRKEISRSQSLSDSASVRMNQIQLDQVLAEIGYRQEQLQKTQIRSPVDGVLITPKVEEKAGSLMEKGEEFCEVANMQTPRAEILVDEGEAAYLQTGQKIRLKMNAYPTMKFNGVITHLGTQMVSHDPWVYYRVEAQVDNPDLLLKPGMVGKAKIEVGYHSTGYVLLRKPFRFLWKKLWVWLP